MYKYKYKYKYGMMDHDKERLGAIRKADKLLIATIESYYTNCCCWPPFRKPAPPCGDHRLSTDRSSVNFDFKDVPLNTKELKFEVAVPVPAPEDMTFNVKVQQQHGSDSTIYSSVKNGGYKSYEPRYNHNLYIANPSKTPRNFTVQIYAITG